MKRVNGRAAVVTGLVLVLAQSAAAAELTLPPVPSVPEVTNQLPSVPQVTNQLPSVPQVTNQLPGRVPSVTSPSAGSGSSASRPSGSGARSVSRAASSGSGGRPAPSGSGQPGRSAPGDSGAGRSGSRSAGTPLAATGPVRRERRLRSTVARLDSCLGGLPALERRVLVLRSGLGARQPRSRAGVGRALDLSPRRVGRVERRGLRRLRGLAGGGRCQGAPTRLDAVAPAPTPAWDTPTTRSAARGPFATPRSQDRIEVKAERESSGSGRDDAPAELAPPADQRPGTPPPPPAAVVTRGGDGGTELTIPLLLLVALGCIWLAVRNARGTVRD